MQAILLFVKLPCRVHDEEREEEAQRYKLSEF